MQIKLPEIKGAAVMILLEEIKKSKAERRFCFGKGRELMEKRPLELGEGIFHL
jgi:hypothetical protein